METKPQSLSESVLRGCRARPTCSYALSKRIATPRQPRTGNQRGVRAVRRRHSVTVSEHVDLCCLGACGDLFTPRTPRTDPTLSALDHLHPVTSAPQMPAVVSDDHADESLSVAGMMPTPTSSAAANRRILKEEVKEHNGKDGDRSFWAVIDGFVVDASEFVDSHPGGLKKLLAADSAATGATGQPFGFSFSRGRNAHFPDTGKRFKDGVKKYLSGEGDGSVAFPPYGKLVMLGRLEV